MFTQTWFYTEAGAEAEGRVFNRKPQRQKAPRVAFEFFLPFQKLYNIKKKTEPCCYKCDLDQQHLYHLGAC